MTGDASPSGSAGGRGSPRGRGRGRGRRGGRTPASPPELQDTPVVAMPQTSSGDMPKQEALAGATGAAAAAGEPPASSSAPADGPPRGAGASGQALQAAAPAVGPSSSAATAANAQQAGAMSSTGGAMPAQHSGNALGSSPSSGGAPGPALQPGAPVSDPAAPTVQIIIAQPPSEAPSSTTVPQRPVITSPINEGKGARGRWVFVSYLISLPPSM